MTSARRTRPRLTAGRSAGYYRLDMRPRLACLCLPLLLHAQGSGTVPSLRGTVDLVIGSEDDEHYLFASVVGIAADASGRIVVADLGQKSVRLYDAKGHFLYAVGREGKGPGEYIRGCCVRFSPSGELWVRDMGNSRYVRFALEASRAVEHGVAKMQESTDRALAVGFGFTPEGALVDLGATHAPLSPSAGFNLHVTTPDGRVVRTGHARAAPIESLDVQVVPYDPGGGGRAEAYFWSPYAAQSLFALAPNGDFALAMSSRYAVSWHAVDGAKKRVITRANVERPLLSAAERARAAEAVERDTKRSGGKAHLEVPERKQPLRALHFDLSGRLWIERSVADGAEREADVYEPGGKRVQTRRWPSNVDLTFGHLGDAFALGVRTDSLGVPQVVRVRFR